MIDEAKISVLGSSIEQHLHVPELIGISAIPNRTGGTVLPLSGNNAFVFRCNVNGREVALRVFKTHRKIGVDRYKEIHKKIESINCYSLSKFSFYENGFELDGMRYPVIVMDWLKGLNLISAIEKSNNIGEIEQNIVKSFLEIKYAKFAHGDLQHDNIFIDDKNQVKFFDFDGCFFQEISTMKPREFGSPSYTHPERMSRRIYDEKIDDFSMWIIFLGIKLAAIDKTLISYGRNDGIVFTENDYINPSQSEIITKLSKSSDKLIVRIFEFVTSNLILPGYSRIPQFSIDALINFGFIERPSVIRRMVRNTIPRWLADEIAPMSIRPVQSKSNVRLSAPSWLEEPIIPIKKIDFAAGAPLRTKPEWLNSDEVSVPVKIIRIPRS